MKVFVIKSEHHNDGDWSAVEAVCGSAERAERWLEENGWIRLPEGIGEDFDWGKLYMSDDPDPSRFDTHNGWEGAYVIPMEVLE